MKNITSNSPLESFYDKRFMTNAKNKCTPSTKKLSRYKRKINVLKIIKLQMKRPNTKREYSNVLNKKNNKKTIKKSKSTKNILSF